MPIVVDKNCFSVNEVSGYVRIDDQNNQLVFPNWFEFYSWLFKKHCIICGDAGVWMHHIIPRSHGKASSDWTNIVLVCTKCHNEIHDAGINKTNIVKLQRKRAEVLRSYGRKGFIL